MFTMFVQVINTFKGLVLSNKDLAKRMVYFAIFESGLIPSLRLHNFDVWLFQSVQKVVKDQLLEQNK